MCIRDSPEILPQHFNYKYPFPFEELDFHMEDGGKINALYFKVPNSRGVVYYLKGNSKSIKGWGKFAKDFLSNGYDFFMMDYRGFGKSKGRRSQSVSYTHLDDDITAILTYIRNEWSNTAGPMDRRTVGMARILAQGRVQPWTTEALNTYIESTRDTVNSK